MNRDIAIEIVSDKLKLIRTEANYTQDKMAHILGISKKTLVQIEKGRTLTNWTNCIAICALFNESATLKNALGGEPLEVIELLAHEVDIIPQEKTLGGHVWWRNIEVSGQYKLQQNVISQHYRIIDDENYRLISSFDEETVQQYWEELHRTL